MSISPRVALLVLGSLVTTVSPGCGGGSATGPLPAFLCRPCDSDADCGPLGNRCLDLPGGGAACGIDCGAGACPAGFMCASIAGSDGRNCFPQSGQCPATGPCNGGCDNGWQCDPASSVCLPPWDAGTLLAGAPLSSSREFYGFLKVAIGTDGQVTGTAYREDTGLPVDSFTVAP